MSHPLFFAALIMRSFDSLQVHEIGYSQGSLLATAWPGELHLRGLAQPWRFELRGVQSSLGHPWGGGEQTAPSELEHEIPICKKKEKGGGNEKGRD